MAAAHGGGVAKIAVAQRSIIERRRRHRGGVAYEQAGEIIISKWRGVNNGQSKWRKWRRYQQYRTAGGISVAPASAGVAKNEDGGARRWRHQRRRRRRDMAAAVAQISGGVKNGGGGASSKPRRTVAAHRYCSFSAYHNTRTLCAVFTRACLQRTFPLRCLARASNACLSLLRAGVTAKGGRRPSWRMA